MEEEAGLTGTYVISSDNYLLLSSFSWNFCFLFLVSLFLFKLVIGYSVLLFFSFHFPFRWTSSDKIVPWRQEIFYWPSPPEVSLNNFVPKSALILILSLILYVYAEPFSVSPFQTSFLRQDCTMKTANILVAVSVWGHFRQLCPRISLDCHPISNTVFVLLDILLFSLSDKLPQARLHYEAATILLSVSVWGHFRQLCPRKSLDHHPISNTVFVFFFSPFQTSFIKHNYIAVTTSLFLAVFVQNLSGQLSPCPVTNLTHTHHFFLFFRQTSSEKKLPV